MQTMKLNPRVPKPIDSANEKLVHGLIEKIA
jgi:hypothetical protein